MLIEESQGSKRKIKYCPEQNTHLELSTTFLPTYSTHLTCIRLPNTIEGMTSPPTLSATLLLAPPESVAPFASASASKKLGKGSSRKKNQGMMGNRKPVRSPCKMDENIPSVVAERQIVLTSVLW